MSLTNDQITAKNFKDFYNQIRPYLNGEAHAGFTPVGTVISVMGKTAPQNYLVCDGTAYNIADYPELAAYFVEQFESVNFFGGDGTTTFAVPDLRGEFLRGTGTNGHTDTYAGQTISMGSGSNVGEHQSATVHVAAYSTEGNIIVRKKSSSEGLMTRSVDSSINSGTYAKVSSSNGTSTAVAGFTSRPTNTSVLYCIAVKNIFNDASEGQADVMPIASANYKDRIVQYVGATNATYTNGFFYKCIEDSSVSPATYSWEPVNTQNEPEALSSSDMTDIKAAFSGMNKGAPLRMMNYSTDEQVVGEWIDGKPIYQRTLDLINVTNTNKSIVDMTSWNYETIINMFATILYHAGSATGQIYGRTTQGNSWAGTTNNYYLCIEPPHNLVIYNAIDNASGKNVNIYHYVTVQYTKTTD